MGNTRRISLQEGICFHGHLGPYLVLGILAGEIALRRLKAKKFFGLMVTVWGATQRPKSCLIDGLQLSTGATYGKGNIRKIPARRIRIRVQNLKSKKQIVVVLHNDIVKQLKSLVGHEDSEAFAKVLYRKEPSRIFTVV
jgi:formylmethanofuran dehydrogenase subunit E